MKIVSLEENSICQVPGCGVPATEIVYDRRSGEILLTCELHGDEVVDRGWPEYQETCPNCACRFGVN